MEAGFVRTLIAGWNERKFAGANSSNPFRRAQNSSHFNFKGGLQWLRKGLQAQEAAQAQEADQAQEVDKFAVKANVLF